MRAVGFLPRSGVEPGQAHATSATSSCGVPRSIRLEQGVAELVQRRAGELGRSWPDQPGHPLVEGAVAALDEPVGVQQHGRARRQGRARVSDALGGRRRRPA